MCGARKFHSVLSDEGGARLCVVKIQAGACWWSGMIDYVCIFTKGGALLWTWQLAALRGLPVDALIRTCLLEERSGESSFSYTPPSGAAYTLKWTLHNGLGLVFVAVYQRALKLLYVDALLERLKAEFAEQYQPRVLEYPAFADSFAAALADAEAGAAPSKREAGAPGKGAALRKAGDKTQAGSDQRLSGKSSDDNGERSGAPAHDKDSKSGSAHANGRALGNGGSAANGGPADENGGSAAEGAFDRSKFEKLAKRPPAGLAGRKGGARKGPPGKDKAAKGEDKGKVGKVARKWDSSSDNGELDCSEQPGGASTADDSDGCAPSARAPTADLTLKSRVDVDEDDDEDDEEEEEEEKEAAVAGGQAAAVAGASKVKAGGGLLGAFVRSLGVSVVGTAALTREDIAGALAQLKRRLMERNVAEEIAEKVCESVAVNLEGRRLAGFTRIGTAVRAAVEEALHRILTPRRSVDILREVRQAKARGRPYTIVFVGVNGVGKSTNLAKVAYWLLQNDVSVMIAACDTFRSGAVEQLKTHCARLGVPLYERGYEKDPAKVAYEAQRAAARESTDVLLVDTAGRMQDNEPLMRALSSLIALNRPDLVLFVGEALVGNDAVDQLTKFNRRLTDLAHDQTQAHTIDGILLTKFDTIDDKVGAALSMVYSSGAPIMFVGCGQTYVDLTKLNVKSIVRSLLK
ncbi:hypothetical protein WJX81_003505 [Elliptochloris bilobata]|uniref:SRP54-type proteins GTP-binding domain-containing protein n=1 Tax=Elliptochloris bilobata TaxID=381761 RepID=A0AAW1RGD0_9CHLO